MVKNASQRRRTTQALLTALPTFADTEEEVVHVVVETPKGSSYKFKYEPRAGAFRLKSILPEGLAYPYDFGFLPSTEGEDGDPLDVLLLLDHPVPTGCVAKARLVGVIEIRQRRRESKETRQWRRNDRFIAVETHGHTWRHVRSLDNLASEMLDQIEAFFFQVARAGGKDMEVLGRSSPQTARKLTKAGRLKPKS